MRTRDTGRAFRVGRGIVLGLAIFPAAGCARASDTVDAVFRFEQSVLRVERDAPDAEPVVEEYSRRGWLLGSWAAGPVPALTLAECEIAAPAGVLSRPHLWSREELSGLDQAARAARQLEWGWPAASTDLLFDAEHEGDGPSVAGAPLPFHALVLATIRPPEGWMRGEGARGTITVAWGAAVFPVQIQVAPDAERPGWRRVELDREPVPFRGRTGAFLLRASGRWSFRPVAGEPFPSEVAGEFDLRFLVRTVREGVVVEGDLAQARAVFDYVRLEHARFDERRLEIAAPPGGPPPTG